MEKRNEIDQLLNSLDGMHRASAGDFFFTRLQARLAREELNGWARVTAFITKPRVALVTLGLILLLNVAALLYQQKSSMFSTAEQVEQATADDYNTTLAANSYYNENSESR
ncbi:MAG: hypothetical protein ABIU63_11685 [Chitinophagaceae bacterium]